MENNKQLYHTSATKLAQDSMRSLIFFGILVGNFWENSMKGLIGALLFSLCYSHSHLANPLPTRRLDCRAGNGRHKDCYGPCPALDTYGEPTGITPARPAETWRRGERRWITWHRNNHGNGESGFVRMTLVPVNEMTVKGAHDKFTFQISCWSSGLHKCGSRHINACGNDAGAMAYAVDISVPISYPDGVYAFGWSWYGGGNFKGGSMFGDYYSCSFVHIKGGQGPAFVSKPVFKPGINQPYKDACISTTDRLGVCAREPCRGKHVQRMRPKGLPRAILFADLAGERDTGGLPPRFAQTKPKVKRKLPRVLEEAKKKNRLGFHIEGIDIYDVRTRRNRFEKRIRFSVKVKHYSKGFTVGVRIKGAVDKVIFKTHAGIHIEKYAPYVINGNDSRYYPIDCRIGTMFHFSATVYGKSQKIATKKYRISCV